MKTAIRVLITGAAGQIGYALVGPLCRGEAFGADQPVELVLFDLPQMQESLGGLAMELEDCSFCLLKKVVCTATIEEAFKDIDVALLVGSLPRKDGMERAELLRLNGKIFYEQGKALDQYAKKTVKVLVVGNPANTNCLIAMNNAPSIPRTNFSCLTRLDHNRAVAQVALKLNICPTKVKNVIIWGNHSSTQYPDVHHATVSEEGADVPIYHKIEEAWLKGPFIPIIQQRGAAIIKARKLSSALSAAKAICDHMRDWLVGTKEGEWVSMGVRSDGSYGVPEDLIFSFPCKCENGEYSIVKGLNIDAFSQEKIDETTKELQSEKEVA